MFVDNVNVYDFGKSVVASGLPMSAHYDSEEFLREANEVERRLETGSKENKHIKRICKLSEFNTNSGHCNALSGILVAFNVTATVKWYTQFQRYHFMQIVSSQSTMHKICQLAENDKAFSSYVSVNNKNALKKAVADYNNGIISFNELIDNCPMGIQLTSRVTTNYLQLRTIYNQRSEHKYHEWGPLLNMIENLPYFEELIKGNNNNGRTN